MKMSAQISHTKMTSKLMWERLAASQVNMCAVEQTILKMFTNKINIPILAIFSQYLHNTKTCTKWYTKHKHQQKRRCPTQTPADTVQLLMSNVHQTKPKHVHHNTAQSIIQHQLTVHDFAHKWCQLKQQATTSALCWLRSRSEFKKWGPSEWTQIKTRRSTFTSAVQSSINSIIFAKMIWPISSGSHNWGSKQQLVHCAESALCCSAILHQLNHLCKVIGLIGSGNHNWSCEQQLVHCADSALC